LKVDLASHGVLQELDSIFVKLHQLLMPTTPRPDRLCRDPQAREVGRRVVVLRLPRGPGDVRAGSGFTNRRTTTELKQAEQEVKSKLKDPSHDDQVSQDADVKKEVDLTLVEKHSVVAEQLVSSRRCLEQIVDKLSRTETDVSQDKSMKTANQNEIKNTDKSMKTANQNEIKNTGIRAGSAVEARFRGNWLPATVTQVMQPSQPSQPDHGQLFIVQYQQSGQFGGVSPPNIRLRQVQAKNEESRMGDTPGTTTAESSNLPRTGKASLPRVLTYESPGGSTRQDVTTPAQLTCGLCGLLARRAVRPVCSTSSVCWNCAVKQITRTHQCWECEEAATTELHLVQDTQLRQVIKEYLAAEKRN